MRAPMTNIANDVHRLDWSKFLGRFGEVGDRLIMQICQIRESPAVV
jgi:hypothetical protein